MFQRWLHLPLAKEETCFLWGPRQSGKSTLLGRLFPDVLRYDLLLAKEFRRLLDNPGILREDCEAENLTGKTQRDPIVIDEIQKIPDLLDEVHWLMENRRLRFILCGSSARKLKRNQANLLGGRAVRYELFPLVFPEIPHFSLEKALNHGLLPRHYLSQHPRRLIQSYLGDYLKEEVKAEALVRNLVSFNRFLEVAALSNGELINFTNMARECGVSAPTVREYYQILVDTLLGDFLPSFQKRAKRRTYIAPKFYFFDPGIVAGLTHRGVIQKGSELFGKVFEHFIGHEIKAHSSYSEKFYPISFWRTTSGFEVDFILGDHQVAIEVKGTSRIQAQHLKGLKAFREEFTCQKQILVCLEPRTRKMADGIEIMPWEIFLKNLWKNKIL